MCGGFQFLRGIGKYGSIKNLAGCAEGEGMAFHVRYLKPADSGPVAALLWHQITGKVVIRRILIDTQPCSFLPVAVFFLRASSLQGKLFSCFRCNEPHAKGWKLRQALLPLK